MGAYYDEIEIEDMTWDAEKRVYHYPCPCGDRFEISKKQLSEYEDIAICPSCSLVIRVIYDPLDYEDYEEDDDDGEEEGEEEQEEQEEEEKDEEEDSDSDNDNFEDALENLHIGTNSARTVEVTVA